MYFVINNIWHLKQITTFNLNENIDFIKCLRVILCVKFNVDKFTSPFDI